MEATHRPSHPTKRSHSQWRRAACLMPSSSDATNNKKKGQFYQFHSFYVRVYSIKLTKQKVENTTEQLRIAFFFYRHLLRQNENVLFLLRRSFYYHVLFTRRPFSSQIEKLKRKKQKKHIYCLFSLNSSISKVAGEQSAFPQTHTQRAKSCHSGKLY